MTIKKLLLSLTVSLFTIMPSFAQSIRWEELAGNISKNIFVEDQYKKLQLIREQAITEGDDISFARSSWMMMTVADIQSEDSVFLRNSLFIDSTLSSDKTSPLLRSVMHMLKAKRLEKFKSDWLFSSKKNLLWVPSNAVQYRSLSRGETDSLIMHQYDSAYLSSDQFKKHDIKELLWLSSDPLLFLFKPDYNDLIFAEQVRFADRTTSYFRDLYQGWLKDSPDEFLSKKDAAQIDSSYRGIYLLYQKWANYHATEKEKYYFIESLARRYFYKKKYSSVEENALYEKYLINLTHSPYAAVKVNAVYQLSAEWFKKGELYYNRYAFHRSYNNSYDTSYRYYYQRLLQLIESNTALLDSFYFLKKDLQHIRSQINSQSISIQGRDVYMPGEELTFHLTFKNARTFNYKIVKLNSLTEMGKVSFSPFDTLSLLSATPVKEDKYPLPVTNDYQVHSTLISLDQLSTGTYAMIYSDTSLSVNAHLVGLLKFSVSNVTAINNDNTVFVLDRTTGQPLPKAKLIAEYKDLWNGPLKLSSPKKVSADGSVKVKESYVRHLYVVNGTDTLQTEFNDNSNDLPDEMLGEDEDLVDYYEDQTSLHFFTDRSIYRPGQTVFFKGILLTRDPLTGRQIVVNKKNMKPLFFNQYISDKDEEEVNKKKYDSIPVYVKDAFGKTLDTIRLFVNEYGSFAGSYKINDKAATGQWTLETEIDTEYENSGEFSVEEYKRPDFEIEIIKPTAFIAMGDSFFVKVKARSFAGAQLNNIKVNYSLNAKFTLPLKTDITKAIQRNISLSDTVGTTDNNGELMIKVPSDFLANYHIDDSILINTYYAINVEAIDGTGESHEATLDITVSNRPVNISSYTNKFYEKNEPVYMTISAKNEFSGPVNKPLHIKLYKKNDLPYEDEREWKDTDHSFVNGQWIYAVTSATKEKDADLKQLVFQTDLISNGEKLAIPASFLHTGNYVLEITSTENGRITGMMKREFSVFDKKENTFPQNLKDFHLLPVNNISKKDKIQWYSGNRGPDIYSIYHVQYFSKDKKRMTVTYHYESKKQKAGLNTWTFKVPSNLTGDQMDITHLYVLKGKLYKEATTVYITQPASNNPEIIIEKYRKKMLPGGSDKFIVTIKTNNSNTAAELMSTLYDASLDKIEKHKWDIPKNRLHYNINNKWNAQIYAAVSSEKYPAPSSLITKTAKGMQPLWWMNPLDYAYTGYIFDDGTGIITASALQGKVSGLNIINYYSSGLSEVVVTSLGIQRQKKDMGYATIKLRGATSIQGHNVPFVIIDGVPYEGDLSKIDINLITDGIILKGADAIEIYGSQASGGVILLSTKGPVQLPSSEEPVLKVRKNFSETAFFVPQIHADADGYYNISFTMPESVTEWNWKMLAHTKDARFAYAEKKIVTQLPLMVQPNMPRFLYQGDMIQLQTRITNLDTLALTGTATCKIEDAVTGEDITAKICKTTSSTFSIGKRSNGNVGFLLNIPGDMLHPLTIRISARSDNFADGEEYTIPVLSKKILVTQNMPVTLVDSKDSSISIPALPADAVPYGIGMYISPKPQAAMMNALPYLAFYPYGCAEQTFNKLLAHSLAATIIQKDRITTGNIQDTSSGENKTITPQALPEELSEQTMPWLQLNHVTQLQQQRLQKLFDTTAGKILQEKYFADLLSLQNSDGGFTWFPGGKSNTYISYYIMDGFGNLLKDGLLLSKNINTSKMISSLLPYCDNEFVNSLYSSTDDLFFLSTRSYWKNIPLSPSVIKRADSILKKYWANVNGYGLSAQSILITASMRYRGSNNVFYDLATRQLESIRQMAVTDRVNGLRWKDISNKDDFNTNEEETIAMLAKAFEETGTSKTEVDGIITWLLKTKQQHNWSTTKSTAAIVGVLHRNLPSLTGDPLMLSTIMNDSTTSVTDDLLKGQLFSFREMKKFPARILLSKNRDITTSGGLNYYYFTANPPQRNDAENVVISKKLFRLDKTSGNWETITEQAMLKIADKVKTEITITAPRQLKYVFIDEKRAAALDPENNLSGYEYGSRFGYYSSVRDAGYQFFAEQIPSGVSVISYETVVAKEGIFNNGTVSLQCMYQPQVRAYGAGMTISVTK